MSRAHHLLLKKICHNLETLERAKAVLHTASIKTAQGSGYELGQGSSGLPAICAYIAAEELGDSDVTESIAQGASCLKPKVFKTTLNTVKAALSAASTSTALSPKKSLRNVSYIALVTEKKIGRKGMVVGWMQAAEQRFMANREMRRKFATAYDAITVSVFCWTCNLMKSHRINAEALLDNYNIPRDQFDEITEALDDLCESIAKEVNAAISSLKASTSVTKTAVVPTKATTAPTKATTAPTKTANKGPTLPPALPPPTPSRAAALMRSPSKSALRAPSADLSPRKTPAHKRKVAFDGPIAEEDEFDALATPSKRQKFSSPIKEPATASPRKSSRLAHSAARPEEEEDALPREADSAGAVPSTPRRKRIAPAQPSSTHSTRSVRSGRSQTATPTKRKPALATVPEDEERAPRRRYRPVFADTQQWMRGDPRLERALRPWTERWKELVGSCGGDVWAAARVVEVGRAGGAVGAAS
ncbi:hypothetical protein BD413DRAFT_628852 [Trametes elegans]|nr:hypothetical protein BD413DRAFT_628852 [Trametes elegans]